MENLKVVYVLKKIDKMIFREFLKDKEIANRVKCTHPTPTQIQILEYILKHIDEDVYQKDLEKILSLRRATVSGVLKTMEKNNLIQRVTNKNDTREKKIILKEEAKEIFRNNFFRIMKLMEKNLYKSTQESQKII